MTSHTNRKLKFFKGWMSYAKMDLHWLLHWKSVSREAEQNDEEIILFKIPKGTNLAEQIDAFIQKQQHND